LKPLITLTTDLGTKDYYLASIKGRILSQMPDAQIIDINNDVKQFSVLEAAYMLKNVINDFPKGTIHIVGVGSGAINDIQHLIIEHKNQWIITANSGLFNLITDEKPMFAGIVNVDPNLDILTFPARDLYAPIAVHLAKGGDPREITISTENLAKSIQLQPATGDGFIKGSVQYVDSFGNAITNIHRSLIDKIGPGAEYIVGFRRKGFDIKRMSLRYSDVPPSERMALFNSAGYLEIAINEGHAANLLGLHAEEAVIISFL
jgi:S-adenosylmethionine hydrolase